MAPVTVLLVVITVGVWVMAAESVVFAVQRLGRWRSERRELRVAARLLRDRLAAERTGSHRNVTTDDEGLEPIESGPLL